MAEDVLALDLDGVAHGAADPIFADFRRPQPAWQLSVQLRAQGRLVWLGRLVEALGDSPVRILVHSTWRRRLSDRDLREILGPEIGDRMIITDGWMSPEDRVNFSHSRYIHEALTAWREIEGVEIGSLCVIDDRPELFSGAQDEALLAPWMPRHIWTDGARGLSDDETFGQLRDWVISSPSRVPEYCVECERRLP